MIYSTKELRKSHFFIYTLLFFLPAIALARPPSVPISINDDIKEQSGKLEDKSLSYQVQIEQSGEVQSAQIEAYLIYQNSEVFEQKRQRVSREKLSRENAKEANIKLQLDKPGVYLLEVLVKGELDEDNGFSDDMHRYVLVDQDGRYRIISPKQFVSEQRKTREERFHNALQKNPDSPDLRLLNESTLKLTPADVRKVKSFEGISKLTARPVGPSGATLKFIEQKSDQAWSPEDPLSISGRLVFNDFDGVSRPLVNVSVNIYDEDVGFDDHLGTVSTDWNGNWSFSVNNDDGWLADGRDIYYTFKLENTRIRVQDCDGIDSTYRWQSATHDNLSEGTVLNFGTETGSTNRNSMQVWNSLNLAWNGAVNLGERDPGFVDSCYPEDGGSLWSRFWEEIDINSADNNGPDIITHEYGHAIMYYAYGSDNPSPGGAHSFGDNAQNASLSWSEGWGTGFMLALRPDGRYNWNEGDTGQSIENFSDAGNRDGNRNEGRVAAAINDMIDAPNDNNGGSLDRGRDEVDDDNSGTRVNLSSLLNDTLWGSWHTDFEDFWASLSGELSGSVLGNANEIMFYNYMDVPEPLSCVATKVTALESKSPDQTLDGLRRFRDHALKDFNGGQQLINSYYRNSPELAWLLIKNSELRKDTMRIVQLFSDFGFAMTNNQRFRKLANTRRPLVSDEMATLIRNVISRIEKEASEELRQDMSQLEPILNKVAGLDVRALQAKMADTKAKHPKMHRKQLQQSTFNPTSQKAAENDEVKGVIKQYIPPFDSE